MNWLLWKQHRTQILVALSILVGYGTLLVFTGIRNAHVTESSFNYTSYNLGYFLVRSSIAMPVLLAMFIGAPLLSKEYAEQRGTNKFIWTQGISRRTWLNNKVIKMLIFVGLYGLAFSLLNTLWSSMLPSYVGNNHFRTLDFCVFGFMPVVYAVSAMALGIMLGAWSRKPLIALGTSMVLTMCLILGVANFIRPHFAHAITVDTSKVNVLGNILITSTEGQPICSPDGTCTPSRYLSYQPASRYWKFQYIETAIYAVLMAGSVIATYRIVLKRDA